MSLRTIPENVRRFISEHIDSVLQLELLLLLRSTGSEWTPAELAEEMRITDHSADFRLREFEQRGLVRPGTRAGSFVYAPHSPDIDGLVAELSDCYLEAKYTIINLIFSEAGDSARTLAEAFRIRKSREP